MPYLRCCVLVAVCLVFVGCAKNAPGSRQSTTPVQQLIVKHMVFKGVKRRYHIRLPIAFSRDKQLPMVLALHGGGGKGANFDTLMTDGTLSFAADQRSVVLVLPEGVRRQWNDGRPELPKVVRAQDDVGFISAVIDDVQRTYNTDPKRIFATGISNGGHMSFRLAMELSDKVTAIAPVVAQLTEVLARTRPGRRDVSVMVISGTDDPLVPYTGGDIMLRKLGRTEKRGKVLSAEDSLNVFLEHNECKADSVRNRTIDNNARDKTAVIIKRYTQCHSGSEAALVTVEGGGHTWPGGKQYLRAKRIGLVSKEINASELILDFFLAK